MGLQGFLFTSPWVVTQNVSRHYATILISTSYDPIEISVNGYRLRYPAIVVSPLVMRNLDARDVGLISVNISPLDLSYKAFRQFNEIGIAPLERQCYADINDKLLLAYLGKLSILDTKTIYRKIIEKTIDQLPFAGKSNAHAEQLLQMLETQPASSLSAIANQPELSRSRGFTGKPDTHIGPLLHLLDAQPVITLSEIAKELGLSGSRTTHLFTSSIGLSLKSYLYWRKIALAGVDLPARYSLTDIAHNAGFADSAHLSRTWKNTFGMSPSYSRNEVQTFRDTTVMPI